MAIYRSELSAIVCAVNAGMTQLWPTILAGTI